MNTIRVCVDGLAKSVTCPSGQTLDVDSRQYLVCTPSGRLILETPDRDAFLGEFTSYETKDYENDRYSPEKVDLINEGLREIRLRKASERG